MQEDPRIFLFSFFLFFLLLSKSQLWSSFTRLLRLCVRACVRMYVGIAVT